EGRAGGVTQRRAGGAHGGSRQGGDGEGPRGRDGGEAVVGEQAQLIGAARRRGGGDRERDAAGCGPAVVSPGHECGVGGAGNSEQADPVVRGAVPNCEGRAGGGSQRRAGGAHGGSRQGGDGEGPRGREGGEAVVGKQAQLIGAARCG